MRYACFALFAVLTALTSACETSDETRAVFDNEYPARESRSPDRVVLYKGWWSVAQLAAPVLPGAESDAVRVVNGSDYAYALLAIGWDPASGRSPTRVIPIRTNTPLSVARGETLFIDISDATTLGNCLTGQPLSQDDADFITQRIFPGPFTGLHYDAASCTTTRLAAGAGEAGAGGAE